MAAKTSGLSLDKRRNYDKALMAEALRLACESRSTQAAARQLGISPKLLSRWQQAQPPAKLIVHFDQGSQYTAIRFKDLVAKHGAQQSVSRRGNCYDNAHAESFWSCFKAELLDSGYFPGLV